MTRDADPRAAVVLTAGLGTRLQPLTFVRAKPAVPVGGEPLVRRIVRWLADHGVGNLVLNLHHLPHTVAGAVGDGADLGAHVRYSWEQPEVLGTAGGPRMAQPILGAESFLVVNGDTLTDAPLGGLWSAHVESGALVTLALVKNTAPDRYGGVLLDQNGWVRQVVPRGATGDSYHFVGVQAVQAQAFEAVRPGTAANSIGDVYDQLMSARTPRVRGYVCEATFWDIGTIADYWHTSHRLSADPCGGTRTLIDPSSVVRRSILWDDVTVGAQCTIDECILTDGVSVAPGSVYRRMVLIRHANGTTAATPFTVE